MPASEVMKKFRAGTLHSGKGGPVVRSKAQATAIQLSYARKEGHRIPYKKSKDSVPLSSLAGRRRRK